MNNETLEVTNQMRLVGLILSDDLTWTANTDSMVKRAYAKLWILRRLKQMGAESNILKLIYFLHVRSILEFGVPVWNGAITKKEVSKIERVQKIAIHIIYGKQLSYTQSCKNFKIEKLIVRREKLCTNFAKKALKHEKFSEWFVKEESDNSQKTKYLQTISRGKRLDKAPIPYLTRLLNY